MLTKQRSGKTFHQVALLTLITFAMVMGKLWLNQKSANENLQLKVRIMAQKTARIVELEQNARVLMKDLNTNSTKVVAGTLSQARLKNYIKGWDVNPIAEITDGESLEGYTSKNPYEAINTAVGGLTKVEKHLTRFVESLQSTNNMLETKKQVLAGVPSVKPANGWISSPYGKRRSPVTGKWVHHNGLDIAAPLGSSVVAAAAGRIIHSGWKGAFGRLIEIDHGQGIKTRYGHNGKLFVKKGDYVLRGQKVATIGMSGRTTGPHLHYEIHLNKKSVNPKRYIDIAPVQHFADPVASVLAAKITTAAPMGGEEQEIFGSSVFKSSGQYQKSYVSEKIDDSIGWLVVAIIAVFALIKSQRTFQIRPAVSVAFNAPFAAIDGLLGKSQPDYDGSDPVMYWQDDENNSDELIEPTDINKYMKAG